jgi:hypothetical protein
MKEEINNILEGKRIVISNTGGDSFEWNMVDKDWKEPVTNHPRRVLGGINELS